MGKIAFMFPGQGAQYIGMGQELYEKYECAKDIFKVANQTLGMDIDKICFNGSDEELKNTAITQVTILTVSIACLEVIKSFKVNPDFAAGLSLGEYSALVCSGALSFKEALKVVKKRGEFMHEAVKDGSWGMLAVLGITEEEARNICISSKDFGFADISNLNCPGQIVIAGEKCTLERISESLKELGKKSVKLNVEGPFHTKVLEEASIKLGKVLEDVQFDDLKVQVTSNVTGDFFKDKDAIKNLLTKQVMSCVRWENSIRNIINQGADTFIEIGPGKTLTGFIKKIDRNLKVYNVENVESLENTIKSLGGKI